MRSGLTPNWKDEMMSTPGSAGAGLLDPMQFLKKLQAISGKIYATSQIDEIMLDLSADICDLFCCERLTLYVLSLGKTHIESKVKTGLRSYKDFSLPISEDSLAGFVALTKRSLNLADVYDASALQAISPGLKFMRAVDERTGFRTREVLVAPLLNQESGELLGVVQLINNRAGGRFSPMMEDGLQDLCETLSLVFSRKLSERLMTPGKYDALVLANLLTAQELTLAQLVARRKQIDIQSLLVDEMHISKNDIGMALAQFFGVAYAPFLPDRPVPERAHEHAKWASAEHKRWLLLEETIAGLVILTTDPDRVKGARLVNHLFHGQNLFFQVTTNQEFLQTAAHFFGLPEPLLQPTDAVGSPQAVAQEQAALARLTGAINHALAAMEPAIAVQLQPEKAHTVRGFGQDGQLQSLRGQLSLTYFIDFAQNPLP
jgi:hypothetical protein